MIHSAKFGSIERFIGVLTEHYAGAFPPWLSPVQVVGIPVTDEQNDYLTSVAAQLRGARASGSRSTTSDDRMQKKIRNAQKQKVPFMLIAGATGRRGRRGVVPLPRRRASATASRSSRPSTRSPTSSRAGSTRRRPPSCMADDVDRLRRAGRAFAGEPDGFERLWTPHRMVYIKGENKPAHDEAGDECPFCAAPGAHATRTG